MEVLAKKAKGMFDVVAVNCDDQKLKSLCQGVKGFPTIKIWVADPYTGKRTNTGKYAPNTRAIARAKYLITRQSSGRRRIFRFE
jgi:hypothetical protein